MQLILVIDICRRCTKRLLEHFSIAQVPSDSGAIQRNRTEGRLSRIFLPFLPVFPMSYFYLYLGLGSTGLPAFLSSLPGRACAFAVVLLGKKYRDTVPIIT